MFSDDGMRKRYLKIQDDKMQWQTCCKETLRSVTHLYVMAIWIDFTTEWAGIGDTNF